MSVFLLLLSTLLYIISFSNALIFPSLPSHDWSNLNKELSPLLSPIHKALSSDAISPSQAAESFSSTLHAFFLSKPEFNSSPSQSYIKRTAKALKKIRKEKNALRRRAFSSSNGSPSLRSDFYRTLNLYSILKKEDKRNAKNKSAAYQEKLYTQSFWSFCRKCCSGSFISSTDSDKKDYLPTFSKDTAESFYFSRYSTASPLNTSKLSWMPPLPKISTPFDLSPITPSIVKNILKSRKNNSAPGPDSIYYGYLKHLPCTHHLLATLYTKILLSGTAPSCWSLSNITLLHKSGSTSDPTNFRMIALSSSVGKTFHLILAARFQSFLLSNKLIDPTMQKAFLSKINGCVEHCSVLNSLLLHARTQKKTLHCTWFDLADAFGSISHPLISYTLSRNQFPPEIISYINCLYSQLSASVITPSWSSSSFSMSQGVFQGDPLSPLIFILCFNPLLDFLKENSKFGYKFKNTSIISLPYADDFNLITTNKRTHQRLLTKICNLATSMNLKLKPSKCCSLSIVSGSPKPIPFTLSDSVTISTLFDKPHKYLGSVIGHSASSSAGFDFIHNKLSSILSNIDSTLIRSEYKLKVYTTFALPSLRFHLTVHDLTKTQLASLDSLTTRFLKSWLSLPPCATTSVLYDPLSLNIPTLTSLYTECHALSYTQLSLSPDPNVRSTLDFKVQLSSTYKHKLESTALAHKIVSPILQASSYLPTPAKQYSHAKRLIKKQLTENLTSSHNDKIQTLLTQGSFLKLLHLEKTDASWKSFIYSLPKGVMSFVIRSHIDCLPSLAALKRMKKRTTTHCPHCKNHETLHHILNCCSAFLHQGRYTWRHNSVLKHLVLALGSAYSSCNSPPQIIADLPGHLSSDSTIPSHILPTSQRPDLVLLFPNKTIFVIELTVPFDTNIYAACSRKTDRYASLITDLRLSSYVTRFFSLEIGSRGFISDSNFNALKSILPTDSTIRPRQLRSDLSRISTLCSYAIFRSRTEPSWISPPLLSIPDFSQ